MPGALGPVDGDERVFVGVAEGGIVQVASQQCAAGAAALGCDQQGRAGDDLLEVKQGVAEDRLIARDAGGLGHRLQLVAVRAGEALHHLPADGEERPAQPGEAEFAEDVVGVLLAPCLG